MKILKDKKQCAECKTRIGTRTSPRRRIAGVRKSDGKTSMHAYALCNSCAENLLGQRWYMLPNVCTDMNQVANLYHGEHVGGVQ